MGVSDGRKVSRVLPIFKKAKYKKRAIIGLCPVLPFTSKIYNFYNLLVEHLETNNLFDDQQHNFQKGRTTVFECCWSLKKSL